MKNLLSATFGAVAVAAFLAGGPGAARADVYEIQVTNNVFTPEFVTINLGDTVRWIFVEGIHSTTAVDGEWDSDLLPPGSVFEYTFDTTGQYDYYCTLHIDCCNMEGSIYVQDVGFQPFSVSPVTGYATGSIHR